MTAKLRKLASCGVEFAKPLGSEFAQVYQQGYAIGLFSFFPSCYLSPAEQSKVVPSCLGQNGERVNQYNDNWQIHDFHEQSKTRNNHNTFVSLGVTIEVSDIRLATREGLFRCWQKYAEASLFCATKGSTIDYMSILFGPARAMDQRMLAELFRIWVFSQDSELHLVDGRGSAPETLQISITSFPSLA